MSHLYYLVTGGPGAGKTTLIEALERAGYGRTVEAGRAVIQAQVAVGGTALPWSDPSAFAALMIEHELRSYPEAAGTGPVFFDRGLPDIVGYLKLTGRPVPPSLDGLCRRRRYNARVFIAPPWPQIDAQDAERKQSFERRCAPMTSWSPPTRPMATN